ncbi:MAG: hypothetical protein Q8M31_09160 [Beijerinckiaceae bacterium]|nr:hypothetical protein [Beijerinckiaceae bacterium]
MTDENRPPAIVVFGLDEQRRPRAGAFPADQEGETAKRAQAVTFVCKPVTATPELLRMAASVPFGDLAKPGAAFVPIVVRTLYDRLLAASGVTGSPGGGSGTSKMSASGASGEKRPASWADIDVGDMVLVAEIEPGDGWYEALIVEKMGPDAFRLKYRDTPDFPLVVRMRKELGLLPPSS